MFEIKKLNATIKAIKTRTATQRAAIQEALKGCAFFAQRDRNMDPAIRLFEAIDNGVNKKAMSHWLSTYAPVYFKDEKPLLSDKTQKKFDGTVEQLIEALEEAVEWTSFNVDGNRSTNTWDTAAFIGKVDAYMLNAIKKLAKHDATLAEAMDRAHNLMRAEIAKVAEVVEK